MNNDDGVSGKAAEHPLVVAAHEYAEINRLIDSLEEQMRTHDMELKKLLSAKQDVRARLLSLIDGPAERPPQMPTTMYVPRP